MKAPSRPAARARRAAAVLTLALALVGALACSPAAPTPETPPAPLVLASELERLEAARESGARAGRPEVIAGAPETAVDSLAVGARLLDPSFRPLADGTLVWCEADPNGLPFERARAHADANGTVWLTLPRAALLEGEPLFLVEAPGHARRLVGAGAVRPGEAAVSLGEVLLEPGGELSGEVRDEAGRPLAGARVWLGELLPEAAQEEPELARLHPDLAPLDGWLVATSDPAGEWRLAHVPPGTWDVLALPAPAGETRVPALGRATVAAGGSSKAGALVLGTARAEERLRGVVRAADGTGRAFARLLLVPADGRRLPRLYGGTADESGHFELLVPAATTWVVEARDAVGLFAPVRSEVVGGGDELELVLGD